jgi:hypothetical protein
MTESALKTLLDNLERSRSSLHGWLHFWTFLVVVGVVLEVVFVVWEYAVELKDFKRGIVHPPEKPSILLLVLGLLGAGLVAVGVAGELYIDVKANSLETEIRKANEDRISLLSGAERLQEEYVYALAHGTRQSQINVSAFRALRNLPKAQAEICYSAYDFEAYWFAALVANNLKKESDWQVDGPLPCDPNAGIPVEGEQVFVRDEETIKQAADQAFAKNPASVLMVLNRGIGGGGRNIGIVDRRLKPNSYKIVIGRKTPPG